MYMSKFKCCEIEIDAFQFYVDNIPDWFMSKVTDNSIILHNCDYKRYDINEAYCMITDMFGNVSRCNGGDMVIRFKSGNVIHINKSAFDCLFYAYA